MVNRYSLEVSPEEEKKILKERKKQFSLSKAVEQINEKTPTPLAREQKAEQLRAEMEKQGWTGRGISGTESVAKPPRYIGGKDPQGYTITGPPADATYGPTGQAIPSEATWLATQPAALDSPNQRLIRKYMDMGLAYGNAVLNASTEAFQNPSALQQQAQNVYAQPSRVLRELRAQPPSWVSQVPSDVSALLGGREPDTSGQPPSALSAANLGKLYGLGEGADTESALRNLLARREGVDPKSMIRTGGVPPELNLLSDDPTGALQNWQQSRFDELNSLTATDAYIASQGGTPAIDKFLQGLADFDEQVSRASLSIGFSPQQLRDVGPIRQQEGETYDQAMQRYMREKYEGEVQQIEERQEAVRGILAGLPSGTAQRDFMSDIVTARTTGVVDPSYLDSNLPTYDPITASLMVDLVEGFWEFNERKALMQIESMDAFRMQEVQAQSRRDLAGYESYLDELGAQLDDIRRQAAAEVDFGRKQELLLLETQMTLQLEGARRAHQTEEAKLDRIQERTLAERGFQQQRGLAEFEAGQRRGLAEFQAGEERGLAGLQAFMSLLQNPQAMAALQTLQGGTPQGAQMVGFSPGGILGGVSGSAGQMFPQGVPTLGNLSALTPVQGQQLEGALGVAGMTLPDLIRQAASVTPQLFGNLSRAVGGGARATERM